MKVALFVAEEKMPCSIEEERLWRNFVKIAKEKTESLSGVARLNEGAYLCNLSFGLHPLSMLSLCAKEWNVVSRILFFDQEPSWVISNNTDPI